MFFKERIDARVYIAAIARLLFFVICFLSLANITNSYSFTTENYYLWLGYDKEPRRLDNPQSETFFIYYGERPNNKNNVSDLDELEAFYTFGKKDKEGKDIYYKLDIIKIGDRFGIEVNSDKKQWCGIVLRGKKVINNNKEYNYIAKTSFFFLERFEQEYFKQRRLHKTRDSLPIWLTVSPAVTLSKVISALGIGGAENANYQTQEKRYTLAGIFNKQFDITLARERLDEPESLIRVIYYSPLRFTVYFQGKPYNSKIVKRINEDGRIKEIQTNKNGEFVYVAGALKPIKDLQELFLAESVFDKSLYKSAYTVLFKCYPSMLWRLESKVDIYGGFGIFFATFILTLIITIFTRKRYRL